MEERSIIEAAHDCLLDPLIGLKVNRRDCLITDDNLRASNECPGNCLQLALTKREVGAFLFDRCVKVDVVALGFILYVLVNQINLMEGGPEL